MAGVLVVVGLVVDNPHFLVAALAPGTLALGLWFVHPREFHAFVNEDGLKVERPAAKIPFSDLEGLTVNGMDQDPADPRFRPGPMVIMHRRGVLHVPAALNLPMQDVYRAILAMLPPHGSHAVSAEFTEHFRKEEAVFGPERVHAFGRRHFAGYRPSTRRGQICAILLVLCGIAWCVVGAMAVRGGKRSAYEPWLGVGIGLIAVGAMSGLALYSWQRPSERRLRAFLNAELIISPTGIALWQGDLKGQLALGGVAGRGLEEAPRVRPHAFYGRRRRSARRWRLPAVRRRSGLHS